MRQRLVGAATAVLAILCHPLVGCSTGGLAQVRYVGPAPSCGRMEGGGETATLTRRGAGFAFAPYDGSLVISGSVAADGSLSGTQSLHPAQSPAASGTAAKPGTPAQTLAVQGRIIAATAEIAYAAPGCTDRLTLRLVNSSLL